MASLELRHMVLDMLRSSGLMKQARALHIQKYLQGIRGQLWAINAVILDAELGDPEQWPVDVSAAIVDLEELLLKILDWQATAGIGLLAFCRRANIVRKLKEMDRRLNSLVGRGSALDFRKDMMSAMDPCQEEYFTILRDEVVGRDEDRDNIIEILQQQQSNTDGFPFIILIQGEEGKTTVARMIYHDQWVRQHFHHRIWVDVSMDNLSSFDPMIIATEFVRSITGEPCGHLQPNHLQAIWSLVNERLDGRRYLLVLNDVCLMEEDKDLWNQLKHTLLCAGAPGSTVIITSHVLSSGAYSMLPSVDKTYSLQRLSEDDWVELFMRHALIRPHHDKDKENAPYMSILTPLAMDHYKQCQGSPLEAKLVGSIFRYTDVIWWQEKVEAFLKFPKQITENQFYVFMFLNHLSPRFGRYRQYCSLVPKDCEFDPRDLLHMLIVEGLAPHSTDKDQAIRRVEDDIELRLEKRAQPRGQHYCSMKIDRVTKIPQQCLYLFLLVHHNAPLTFPTAALSRENKLRTLIVHKAQERVSNDKNCKIAEEIPEGMFLKLLHLRILYLRAIRIHQLPYAVGRLRNLKYLNLSQTEIQTLPASCCDLRNLQILNLASCDKLQKLPERIHNLQKLQIVKLAYCPKLRMLPKWITRLVNLQELDLEGCCWLVELPEGLSNMKKLRELNVHNCLSFTRIPREMGQLTNLQTLLGYLAVDNLGSATPELQALTNLRELSLENLQLLSNTENLKWEDREKLKYLAFHWKWWNMDVKPVSEASLIEDLQPNPALKKLEIISYMGKNIASWMTNKEHCRKYSLVEISLVNIRRCDKLPPLGELCSLEVVEISGMNLVSVLGDEFYGDSGTFPKLKRLTLSEMPMLEEWLNVERETKLFPYLEELTLIQCPKLRVLHVRFSSKLSLKIMMNSGILSSKFTSWYNFKNVDEIKIFGCEEMRDLPKGMRLLNIIRRLMIIRCNKLKEVPYWVARMRSIRDFGLSGCNLVTFVPRRPAQRPPEWNIEGCPNVKLY